RSPRGVTGEANPSGLPKPTHRPGELAKMIDKAFSHRTQHSVFQCNNDDECSPVSQVYRQRLETKLLGAGSQHRTRKRPDVIAPSQKVGAQWNGWRHQRDRRHLKPPRLKSLDNTCVIERVLARQYPWGGAQL